MRYAQLVSLLVVSIVLTISVSSCKEGGSDLNKIYSRNLTLQHVKETELQAVLDRIESVTNANKKDVRKDNDGNDMFLYSSSDVVVFVRRKFDEPCSELGCSWKIDVSSAKASLPEFSQKEAVDAVLASMIRNDDIHSHLNIGSKER